LIFPNLPMGADVFVDANTLVYHFAPDPVLGTPCSDLLVRIKRQELHGFTSTHIVAEMAHRLMTLEAIKTLGWRSGKIGQRLGKNPAEVQKLTAFRQAIREVPVFGITILTIPPDLLDAAAGISQGFGLLTNDALIVAIMQANHLANLASNDGDFDRVPGLNRYAPA
jgi:predicted nucleic acid-binding protein